MSQAGTIAQTRAVSAYVELLKPRILTMVLVTCGIGYLLGGVGHYAPAVLCWTLLGTAMTAGGAATLNNYLERDIDKSMERTRRRTLPRGVVPANHALLFGVYLVLTGTLVLVWQANLLTGFLGLLSAFLYVLVYTPLKRVSWLNTPVGAIPGAIPPMMGWAAAAGRLDAGAWVLFAILFLWQHPHFYAIAWMCKEDYRRGGFKMLPVVDPTGRRTFRQVLLTSALLVPVSMLPSFVGLLGPLYLWGALLLGLFMLVPGLRFSRNGSIPAARSLMRASLVYLPCILLLILLDMAVWP